MNKVLIGLLCLFLIGCNTVNQQNSSEHQTLFIPVNITSEMQANIERGVKAALKDPNSAIFGPSYGGKLKDGSFITTVCGSVNAKNSFGGYTGAQPFLGHLVGHKFSVSRLGLQERDFIIIYCKKAGLKVF